MEIGGLNDKRQMTVVLAGTPTGEFLPPQLIYSGSTAKSLPKNVSFPPEWQLTTTPTHWSNEATMLQYIDKVINPYVEKKREELKLKPDFPALVLFDHFSGQITQSIFDHLQKLPFKDQLKSSFHSWYASQVKKQVQEGNAGALSPIDLRLSIMKPLHTLWLIKAYNYLKNNPEIVVNGFNAAGILEKLRKSSYTCMTSPSISP